MALAAASASMGAANCSTPNMPWQGAMAGTKVFVYTAQNKNSFEVHACLFYSWHVKCTMDNEVLLLLCCCSAAAALLLCCCCPAAAALLLLLCCSCPAALLLLLCQNMPINFNHFL